MTPEKCHSVSHTCVTLGCDTGHKGLMPGVTSTFCPGILGVTVGSGHTMVVLYEYINYSFPSSRRINTLGASLTRRHRGCIAASGAFGLSDRVCFLARAWLCGWQLAVFLHKCSRTALTVAPQHPPGHGRPPQCRVVARRVPLCLVGVHLVPVC